MHLGALSELMGEFESASQSYERALVHNPSSIRAMVGISCILRAKDQFPVAVEYLQHILRIEPNSGDTWSSLGTITIIPPTATNAYRYQVIATSC